MAFVRVLGNLLKDPTLGPRVVPIVADEARTFGMASLFRQVGIYAPLGQLYQPEDSGSIVSYREDRSGQILEEGITEAGALSSWTAAATSYSTHGLRDAAVLHLLLDVRLPARRRPDLGRRRPARARLPDRRDGGPDDARGRGPAAPGRHQPPRRRDGAELPAYDPAFAGELAVIVDRGMREMLERAAGRLLLRDGDERERRAAVAAARRARRACCAACTASRAAGKDARARAAARLGRDPRRSAQGRRGPRADARRRRRRLERDQLHRAGARRHRGGGGLAPRRAAASSAATSASSSRRRAARS